MSAASERDLSHVDISRVHMVGIGGAGMSGLARILLERGSTVTGSDRADSAVVADLRERGARISVGHAAENLRLSGKTPTVVVISFAAIPADNPELVAAREQGIPVIVRSDLLSVLMGTSKEILVAGTHGKTSTTSLLVSAMRHAQLDPSFAIGGQLTDSGQGAHAGSGDTFVAEADESDASLLTYHPWVAIVTTVEPDHLDFFGTPEAYTQVFDDFADLLGSTGTLVACADDPGAAALARRAHARGITVLAYGTPAATEALAAHGILVGGVALATQPTVSGTLVDAQVRGAEVRFEVHLPGSHMALNALAALIAGSLAGGELPALAEGIALFGGVRRRFDVRGTIAADNPRYAGVMVVDDYAHHPTEVVAVVAGARELIAARAAGGKLIVAFQPHLYSRTKNFAAEFATALAGADTVICLGVYGAREEPMEGINASTIGSLLQNHADVHVIIEEDIERLPQLVSQVAGPHDIVLTMGAGSITQQADPIIAVLEGATG